MPDRMYTKDEVIANRYVVQHLLGAGNFSYVYKVLDTLSSNVVALKIFKEGTGVLGRLRQEFQILLGLGHVNIARVYDVGQLADGTYFLKLEYIEGDDLAKLIADRRISLGKARQIASELLGAVKYLHDHHVMHRDIKPNNILTGSRGTIIVDFNISKHVQSHASSHVGTPRYMPPEVNVAGWNWTGDLYAVGVVLYEMVTAHYPFDDDYPFLSAEPRDPLEYNQLLSESLVEGPTEIYLSQTRGSISVGGGNDTGTPRRRLGACPAALSTTPTGSGRGQAQRCGSVQAQFQPLPQSSADSVQPEPP